MYTIIKIYSWDSRKTARSNRDVALGKKYVVQTSFGQFIGTPIVIKDDQNEGGMGLSPQDSRDGSHCGSCGGGGADFLMEIIREVNEHDQARLEEHKIKEKEAFDVCREKINQYELPMKLVGANYSLDGGNLVFAFTAENRVDFRELVRDLSHVFQKSVRLEQIGSRDEARISRGYGPCGRELCCSKFNGILRSINTEMARVQQITHRGSERISGCCGRLMCCLAYEADHYEELAAKVPPVGQNVQTREGKGVVKSIKVLQGKVLVELNPGEHRWYHAKDVKVV